MTEQEAVHLDLEHRGKILEKVEKPWYRSKKFAAYLIGQLLMAGMAITALVKQPEMSFSLSAFMLGIVFMMGASTIWMIGKQSALDSAVRGFALLGQTSGTIKGMAWAVGKGDKEDV